MKNLILPLTILSITNLFSNEIKENENYFQNIINDTSEYRKNIHQSLISLSSNIDSYFISEEIKNLDYSSTYAHLQLSSYLNEGDEIVFDQKFKIKLKLPKLKDKFSLEIETSEERETVDNVETHNKSNNDNLNVGIAYYKQLKNHINLKSKAGLKVRSKFDPFIKIEAKKTWIHDESLEYTLSQKFKQSVIKHTESTTFFRVDKKLKEPFSIHNYYQHYWQSTNEKDNQYYTSIYLNQKLSNTKNLTYTIDSNINNIDSEMKVKRYAARITYKQYLRKWMYFDIIPENYYPEDDNFKSKVALRINFGIYFNKDSY